MGLIKNLSDVSAVAGMEEWNGCIRVDNMDGLFMASAQDELSDGGKFLVADGQAALIVKDGVISDFTAETGGYEFNEKMPPSIFGGKFGDSIGNSFDSSDNSPVNMPERCVYYINLAEISRLKFGFGELSFTAPEIQKDIFVRCYGTYDCTVSDPILLFIKFSGNNAACSVAEIAQTLKETLGKAAAMAVAKLSEKKISCSCLADETEYFSEQVRSYVNNEFKSFGIALTALTAENLIPDEDSICAINGVSDEETEFDREWERVLCEEEAAASASPSPEDGNDLPQTETPTETQTKSQSTPAQTQQMPSPSPAQVSDAGTSDSWTCSCGMVNTMGFCPQCGAKKPDKPKCVNCGFEFPESMAGLRFCPNCGKEK